MNKIGAPLGCTVVFTTNYGPSVETFVSTRGGGESTGLSTMLSAKSTRGIGQFSIRLRKMRVPSCSSGARFDELDSGFRRLVRAVSIHAPETEHGYQNAMIYRARKVAIEEPYFTCYDYLGKCLSRAEFCLVVGYSFRDYDVLTRFRAATISNEKLRIAILDPNAQSICSEISRHGINASPINASLGDNPRAYEIAIDGC